MNKPQRGIGPVAHFLTHHANHPEVDLSAVVVDRFGGTSQIKVFKHCALHLLNDKERALGIADIAVDKSCRGNGVGARALQLLLDYADEHDVVLTLYPRAHSQSPLSSSLLAKWYERHGFSRTPRGHVRMPLASGV